ncbi:hypothetical protein K437DRAFT_180891 [Tilletiaria anomala UBC 951]|uniref:Uncharacterized protein n=1 Tax=Tilletiaria anomala (strain ATCC 24038 / CBS 436.72 / UBC 951) TaxID=1037660 RepID=A0A066VR66_TILAU|nr:uncharacterized protein K437DRAFT_180891 [Tilletiaria anomala UBC 951]KDN41080.1 hypothetical protein K437DRAFT_180891 [Tilletiaria anomala UBC 951]
MAILDRKPPLPDGDGAAAVASAESFEALHSSSPHGLSTSSNWQSTQAQPEHVYISTHDGQAPPSYDLATSSNNLSQLPPPQPVEVPTMGSSNEVHEYTPLLADVEYGGRRPGDRDGRQGKNGQKRRVCLRRFFRFATSAITILLFWVIIMDMMSMMSSSIGSDSDSHEELQKPNPNLWPGNTIDWPDWSPVTRQPGENEQYSSTTHLTLDANHGSLFIHNFGQRHSGKVTLETSRGTGDKIQVDVEARATHEFILKEALTVVKKEDGNRFGVGIYSQNRSFEDGRHRLRVCRRYRCIVQKFPCRFKCRQCQIGRWFQSRQDSRVDHERGLNQIDRSNRYGRLPRHL